MRKCVSIWNMTGPELRADARLGKSRATPAGEMAGCLRLWPEELADTSREGRTRTLAAQRRALREERRCGQRGNGAYDVARHAALSRLVKQHRAALAGPQTRTLGLANQK
jgi:hypothetical protein